MKEGVTEYTLLKDSLLLAKARVDENNALILVNYGWSWDTEVKIVLHDGPVAGMKCYASRLHPKSNPDKHPIHCPGTQVDVLGVNKGDTLLSVMLRIQEQLGIGVCDIVGVQGAHPQKGVSQYVYHQNIDSTLVLIPPLYMIPKK